MTGETTALTDMEAEALGHADGALRTAAGCELGEIRQHAKAAHASAYSHNCFHDCKLVQSTQLYSPPRGFGLKDYRVYEEGGYGRHGSEWTHHGSGFSYLSEEQLRREREAAAGVEAVDPNTGAPIRVGGSYKARLIEEAHSRYFTSDDTVKLTAWAKGRDLWKGGSQSDVYIDVELECIGTLDDYKTALQEEIDAARE